MSAALIADKLRASLLQAAIQGKLTKQLAEDGDARDLLQEIEVEKARLIEEKVIKKEKPLPSITEEEIPFEIPANWSWVRLQNIFNIARGGSPRPIQQFITTKDDGINWIKIGDTDIGGKYINTVREKIIPDGIKSSRFVHKGDLLLTNSMSYGRPYILNVDGCIHDGWLAFSPYTITVNKEFFYYLLSSYFIKNQFNNTVSGAVVKNLNRDKVKDVLIPLPPVAEQHRIVEAIEAALAKLDKLKADETKLYDIQKSFPNKLRASLLQSAIQGQLTKQLPEDGNARDLLKEIEAEKARLIAEKIIKKEKPLPAITDEEIPFEIPENWAWVRLGDLCAKVGAGSTPSGGKAVYLDDGVKFIRSQNVHNDGLYLDNVAFIAEKTHFSKKGSTVYPKDLLLNITGGSIGRCCVVPDDFDTANVNQHVLILRLFDEKIRFYLHQVIISPFIFKLIMDLQVGGTKEGLSATSAKNLLIPFPPLAEQQRIVEKLDEILGKVDGLKKIAD